VDIGHTRREKTQLSAQTYSSGTTTKGRKGAEGENTGNGERARLNLVWMDELWEECPTQLGQGELGDRRLAEWIDKVGIQVEVRMVSHEMVCSDAEIETEEAEEKATSILNEYQGIFAIPTGLPSDSQEKYQIITKPNSKAPFKNPYRIRQNEEEELYKQIEAALKNGWLMESTSKYGAPVIFIPKKDRTLRMYIDYRDPIALRQNTDFLCLAQKI